MIIPKEYGGLGFSASANSAVVGKMSSANAVLGITVMVPNSLGPAELLVHYGTEEQKNYYLPRLASHEDIPAFALTEPDAGSDAGAMSASGVVFTGEDGRLKIRLNWNKRYITLAPISTVLGLAFKCQKFVRLSLKYLLRCRNYSVLALFELIRIDLVLICAAPVSKLCEPRKRKRIIVTVGTGPDEWFVSFAKIFN